MLPPTYTDGQPEGVDQRLGPKFASRSRAYVEADRELQDDVRRKRFQQARAAFVEKDEDADDSIDELSGGFARFAGPDRTEAIAHYNIGSLADAALDLERTPSPQLRLPPVEVIPNDQATMLMLLADLSTSQPAIDSSLVISDNAHEDVHLPLPAAPPIAEQQLVKEASPVLPPSESQMHLPSKADLASPATASQQASSHLQDASNPGLNGTNSLKTPEVSERPIPARTTHRIMDMLNNDQDVPVPRTRETQQPVQELNPPGTPSRRDNPVQHETPSRGGAARLENIVNQPEQPEQTEHLVDQQLMDALSGPLPQPSEPPSPARPNLLAWQHSSGPSPNLPPQNLPPPREADESLRRKDPRDTLRKIRELLDRKAAEHGLAPPDRSHYPSAEYYSDAKAKERREAPPTYDPQRPSNGLQGDSDTNGHFSHRRGSYDRGPALWDRDRRTSGSQPSRPSPYQGSPPQPYHGELSRPGPTHQSPYASLPPKPPGPPPSTAVNFRFAHYDPAPPPSVSRPPYQVPPPNYASASHPPHIPPPPPGPYGHTYPSPYQHAYAPPPGSYQVPPPPPPNVAAYPPLKIHQYGGQHILPSSMAPPPHSGAAIPYGQPAGAPVYSPPKTQAPVSQPPPLQPNPLSEQNDRRDSNFMGPQTRPRRAYRSYHAPGTQFRTYNGPGGGRGRGGGGGGGGG